MATAQAEFDAVLGDRPNQLDRQRARGRRSAPAAAAGRRPARPAAITRAGLDTNISVGLRYLASWLSGTGAAAIDDLMEDAATAEISRAQVWQWVHHGVTLADGTLVTADLVRDLLDDDRRPSLTAGGVDAGRGRPGPLRSSSRSPWPTTSPPSSPCPPTSCSPDRQPTSHRNSDPAKDPFR